MSSGATAIMGIINKGDFIGVEGGSSGVTECNENMSTSLSFGGIQHGVTMTTEVNVS